MRAAAVVLALALGAECFAPAPTARSSTALNAAGHAVIVRLRRRKSSSCCLAAVDAVRGVLLPRCRRRCTQRVVASLPSTLYADVGSMS